MSTKTATRVHLIFNAHIDPVWLWPWDSGLDAGLATFRSACDRLDEYPELTFCNGDAWLLCQVERCDPELFARIKAQVASGRWSLYGGWWVQPDCNLPTRAGFERQISLGREYLEGGFGKFTDVARNVDSFGHSAALPEIMAAAGQPNYIMMRPGQNEMKLPARIFRWRGFEGSPEVLAFRVAGTYCFGSAEEGGLAAHVLNAATSLPEGVADTMCFLGVGDHGGGPTKALVESCLRLRDAIPGVKLEFSTPERFFAALRASKAAKFPEVVGELQHHAIGCYPLQRSLKLKLKRAEHLLEALRPSHGAERLKEAWRSVCFNQFHDIMGGTCLPSTHVQADAQAGAALAFAEDELKLELRRKYPALPPDEAQRIVLWNPSDTPFEGHVEFSPWLTEPWTRDSALVDAAGRAVPCQRVPAECPSSLRLLFGAKLQAGGLACLKLELAPKRPAVFKSPWRGVVRLPRRQRPWLRPLPRRRGQRALRGRGAPGPAAAAPRRPERHVDPQFRPLFRGPGGVAALERPFPAAFRPRGRGALTDGDARRPGAPRRPPRPRRRGFPRARVAGQLALEAENPEACPAVQGQGGEAAGRDGGRQGSGP